MKPLIFISYDRKDSDVALRLAKDLRSAGYRTWAYEEDSLPGPSYMEQIVAAMREAEVVTIVISRESIQSQHVRGELFRGYTDGKLLVPILKDMSHGEFSEARPDWHQAMLTNVSIAIPEGGIDVIIERILAGIAMMLEKHFDFTTWKREVPGAVPREEQSGRKVPGGVALGENRLDGFDGEITQMRARLESRWVALSTRFSGAGKWRELAQARVRLTDDVVREVLDYVFAKEDVTPSGYALVARGGYGRGILSEGSDVDLTLLFDGEISNVMGPFWESLVRALTDVCGVLTCLRVSPLAATVEACRLDWNGVIAREDSTRLLSFVSFAYSRFLGGNMKLHDALRDEWRNVALSANAGNVEALKVLLRERLQSKPMDAMERVFNLKKDAGGILEFRLTGFIEQFLSCRLVQFSADDLELAKAHEFFLVLRDHMYRITRSHVVGRSNIEQTCSAMERELNETLSPDELWNKVIGHRRKVRAGFKSAVDALR